MFTNRRINIYQTLLILMFLLALWLRFINLGKMPLSDMEAIPALSAIYTFQQPQSQLSNQPLYELFTSLLFYFFGSSNLIARLLPALAGSVLIPALSLFANKINRIEILILALLLTIDPIFLSLSRQVDSRAFVVVLLIISFGLLLKKQYSIAGFSSALLVLSGIYFWHVLLILCFFLLFGNLFIKITDKRSSDYLKVIFIEKEKIKKYFLYLSISMVIIGTRFFSAPLLLSQIIQCFLDYFSGWVNLYRIFSQARVLLIVLFSSYPLITLFGLTGCVVMLLERKTQAYSLLLLFVFSLLITLAYPASKQVDVIFIIPIPIYFFVEFFAKLLKELEDNIRESLLALIPFILLMGILGLVLLNTVNLSMGFDEIEQLLIAIIGCLLLIGIVFILISWSWSYKYALNGLVIALVLILGVLHLSTVLHVLGVSPRPEAEVWWIDGYFKDADLLLNSIEKISIMNLGLKYNISVAIEDLSSPSLDWLLREYELINFQKIPVQIRPPIIITKEEIPQKFNEEYRGSKFILKATPYWIENLDSILVSNDLLNWFFLRKNFTQNDEIYLWARADLFPGNNIKFENINKD